MLTTRTRCGLAMILMLTTLTATGCQGSGTASPQTTAQDTQRTQAPPAPKGSPATVPGNANVTVDDGAFCDGFRDFVSWAEGETVNNDLLAVAAGANERLPPLAKIAPPDVAEELGVVISFYAAFDPAAAQGTRFGEGQISLPAAMQRLAEHCGFADE